MFLNKRKSFETTRVNVNFVTGVSVEELRKHIVVGDMRSISDLSSPMTVTLTTVTRDVYTISEPRE